MTDIGERCRVARESKGFTVAAVASDAGIDRGHLSRFERGERGLSIESLERLLSVLGLEVLPADRDAVDHGSPSADIVPHDLVNGQCQPVHTEAR